MKALIDPCLIVDVLQNRVPIYDDAMKIVFALSNKQFDGVLTAKSITDIYHIIKHSHNIQSEKETRNQLQTLFRLFGVEDTNANDCMLAFSSSIKDYEKAVMSETAKRIGADCIVIRNLKDYTDSETAVYSPKDFLLKLEEELKKE